MNRPARHAMMDLPNPCPLSAALKALPAFLLGMKTKTDLYDWMKQTRLIVDVPTTWQSRWRDSPDAQFLAIAEDRQMIYTNGAIELCAHAARLAEEHNLSVSLPVHEMLMAGYIGDGYRIGSAKWVGTIPQPWLLVWIDSIDAPPRAFGTLLDAKEFDRAIWLADQRPYYARCYVPGAVIRGMSDEQLIDLTVYLNINYDAGEYKPETLIEVAIRSAPHIEQPAYLRNIVWRWKVFTLVVMCGTELLRVSGPASFSTRFFSILARLPMEVQEYVLHVWRPNTHAVFYTGEWKRLLCGTFVTGATIEWARGKPL